MLHLIAFLLYSALSLVFLRHLIPVWSSFIPGGLEDTRLFLWNAWWFRQAIDTLHTNPFFTKLLFHPFGSSLVSHDFPMWMNAVTYAAQARGLNWIAASNVWFVLTWILSGFCSYLLAWEATKKRAPAVIAGIYVMTHGYTLARAMQNWGQFNLYGIALFLWALLRARRRGGWGDYALGGVALAWTAACHYYFLIYSATICLVIAAIDLGPHLKVFKRHSFWLGRSIWLTLAVIAGGVAGWIIILHPGVIHVGETRIGLETPFNALLVMWISVLIAWLCAYRVERVAEADPLSNTSFAKYLTLVASALICLSPLLIGAFHLTMAGGYPKQHILWKTHLPGANLFALLSPNPIQAIWGARVSAWYDVHGMNAQEQAAGIGWVCLGIILWSRFWKAPRVSVSFLSTQYAALSSRFWLWLSAGATVLAMGTYLHLFNLNTWMPLPFYLWRLLPVFGNVRVPERWMAVGAIGWGVVFAFALITLADRRKWPLNRLCLIAGALVLFENWPGLPIAEPPKNSAVYAALRQQPAGGVLVLPLYIGDSSIGAGNAPPGLIWDYLVFQIYHQHPVLGGYVGRIQRKLITNYKANPYMNQLIELEEGRGAGVNGLGRQQACQAMKDFDVSYVLLYPSALDLATSRFVTQTLPVRPLAKNAVVELSRVACGR